MNETNTNVTDTNENPNVETELDTNVDESLNNQDGSHDVDRQNETDWAAKANETERLLAAEKARIEEQQKKIDDLRSQLSRERNDKRSKEEILQDQLAVNEQKAKELEQKLARAEAARIFANAGINAKTLTETEMETFVTGSESETSALCTTVVSLIERIRKDTEKATRKTLYQEMDIPNTGDGKEPNITKEQFKNMSYSERNELYKEHPALYNKLAGH